MLLAFVLIGLFIYSIIIANPKFFAAVFAFAVFVQILAWIPFTAPIAYSLGWNNPNTIIVHSIGHTINDGYYELGNTKTLTLELTNSSSNYFSEFKLDCQSGKYNFSVYDRDGIRADQQKVIRSYEVDMRVQGKVTCATRSVRKGKPKI